MSLNLSVLTTIDAAPEDGLVIPLTALKGNAATELLGATQAEIDSKGLEALMVLLAQGIANSSPLGLLLNVGNFTVVGQNFRRTFTFTQQFYLDISNGNYGILPLNGNNDGLASLSDLSDGNMVSIASPANPAANSLFIPYSSLNSVYGNTPAFNATNLNDATFDNREVVAALLNWAVVSADIRSNSIASGVFTKTVNNITALTLTNPTTATGLTDLDRQVTFQRTYAVTFDYTVNDNTESYDLNVVTA